MKHQEYICRSYEMARDLSRYVVLNVNVYNPRAKQVYAWTHCEWFNFNMPLDYLFSWIKDIEPEIKDIAISLYCRLNDNTEIPIKKGSTQPLKDICASHIMEIQCVNEKR